MTIKEKVEHAIELDCKIAALTEELNQVKAELINAAEGCPSLHERTECGGWSAVLHGAEDRIARVVWPANKLKSGIDSESDEWLEIKKLISPLHLILFTRDATVSYSPAKSIRENLLSLAADKRRRVLKLVTSKSKPTVSFETKEVV